jgi:UDP-2,3-diacylglucosamine pyrophosphatase LpxH
MLGGAAYDRLVTINRWSNIIRRAMGLQPWSLSAAIKQRVKRACQHVAKYEQTLADEASRRGLDGVVCGHIHKAEVRTILTRDGGEVQYYNCGDWVESLTALVEHDDGTLRVIKPEHLLAPLRGPEVTSSADQALVSADRDEAGGRGTTGPVER